jgi:SAM-dependent methyltransferase
VRRLVGNLSIRKNDELYSGKCTAVHLAKVPAARRQPSVLWSLLRQFPIRECLGYREWSGARTIDLARLLPEATIWAIDTHQPFVDETNWRTAALGVSDRVKALSGDTRSLQFPHSTFDLVWCEGAAYFMGVESALRAWKRVLRPAGRLALSEAVGSLPMRPATPSATGQIIRPWRMCAIG